MSNKINKLNQLKNTESFIQAHTIKGFKYIDKAGEIVNFYHRKNEIPSFSMNLDGLIIEKPMEKIETLKITPTFVWMKFIEIDTLDNISRIYSTELEKICNILEIKQVSRLGWRNYFVYEFINTKQAEKTFERLKILNKTKTEFIRLKIDTDKSFEGTLMLQPLARSDNPEKKAMLFDVDLFKRGETDIKDTQIILRTFREYLQSNGGFLNLVDGILG